MTGSDFAGRRVVVEVPASIANLGAGYDCLGIAVELTLAVTVDVLGAGSGRANGDNTATRGSAMTNLNRLIWGRDHSGVQRPPPQKPEGARRHDDAACRTTQVNAHPRRDAASAGTSAYRLAFTSRMRTDSALYGFCAWVSG